MNVEQPSCDHCGGPGPLQGGLCEGCDYEREHAEAARLMRRSRS